MNIEIPVNVTARVYFPVAGSETITENGMEVKVNKDFELVSSTSQGTILKVGSGKYSFEVKLNKKDASNLLDESYIKHKEDTVKLKYGNQYGNWYDKDSAFVQLNMLNKLLAK